MDIVTTALHIAFVVGEAICLRGIDRSFKYEACSFQLWGKLLDAGGGAQADIVEFTLIGGHS